MPDFPSERNDAVIIVRIPGPLIAANRQELKTRVLEELAKGGRRIFIDFSRTEYIDSSGLGLLVSLRRRVREQGGELRLVNRNDHVMKLFEQTRLASLFPGDDDSGEGEGSAGRPAPRPPGSGGPLRSAAEADPEEPTV